jgi:hypothetical protein
MAESAALLEDEVFPHQPVRQLTPWMACSRAMQEQLPRVPDTNPAPATDFSAVFSLATTRLAQVLPSYLKRLFLERVSLDLCWCQ